VDASNNSLEDKLTISQFECTLIYSENILYMTGNWTETDSPHFLSTCHCYVNDKIGLKAKLHITAGGYDEKNQNTYFIALPVIENPITENILLENNPEEVSCFSQIYNFSKDLTEESYSHLLECWNFYWPKYDYYFENHLSEIPFSTYRTHNRAKPFQLHTNVRAIDTTQKTDFISLSPIFYESEERGPIISNPVALNQNNELIIDFFSRPVSFQSHEGTLESSHHNHLSKVWNKDEFYYEGYRTPILYHQSGNFSAETNPFGSHPQLTNKLLFLGEYGEHKFIHDNVNVKFTGDGKEIFNGNIHLLNETNNLEASCSQYQIEVKNNQVSAYGETMLNYTSIEFDLTKPDANPPTLTMLRVIDNEKVSISISDQNPHLEITAGDFNYPTSEYSTTITYNKKPNLEVSFSIDGETFYELTVEEDVSKFHKSYGNFFNVSLQPVLDFGVDSGWVIVRTILTDEDGNKQTQILHPLFHVGALNMSVEERFPGEQASVAYPNPFQDNVTIELENPLSGEVYFEVYDVTGKIIYQQKYNSNTTSTFQWNGSHVNAGVYFYGIYSKEGVVRGKLLKQF
jgi:hypothetical protein